MKYKTNLLSVFNVYQINQLILYNWWPHTSLHFMVALEKWQLLLSKINLTRPTLLELQMLNKCFFIFLFFKLSHFLNRTFLKKISLFFLSFFFSYLPFRKMSCLLYLFMSILAYICFKINGLYFAGVTSIQCN